MGRIIARETGFKLIYEYLFNKEAEVAAFFKAGNIELENEENTVVIDENNNLVVSDEEKEYAINVYNAVVNNYDELINILGVNIKGFNIDRVYKLDLAILLMAVAEIKFLEQDVALIINESVEIAKKYSTDKSPSFINGVLGGYVKNLK